MEHATFMSKIALLPQNSESRGMTNVATKKFLAAIESGGATLTQVEDATGLIWIDTTGAGALVDVLDKNPQIEWVQLPWAGVENFASTGIFNRPVKFTS